MGTQRMGLFKELGKQVEQFKQDAKSAADEAAAYECAACGARFHTARDDCPDCGADEIRSIDAEAEETTPSESDDSTE
ncbi:DUF7129 domain-containing putative zinc-binding protein [Halorussus amylolyticus]|uniref:DUF7129 domain-containing putative zinc-binding protein n=1 Tax=Halorussus amylolyticus TaxID=1126242 RepID=UPI001EE44FD4|nr:zinc ribbon domain-containing protein [Halorussus amylolyticus]